MGAADHTIHRRVVDDDNLEDLDPISIDGEIFSGMVDPDIVQFDDIGLTVLMVLIAQGHWRPNNTLGQPMDRISCHGSILEKEDRFDPSLVAEDQWWLAVGIPLKRTA